MKSTSKNKNIITEDYVSFETAKLLKEKGFDEVTLKWYLKYKGEYTLVSRGTADHPDSSIDVPTIQMAMKWLREVHSVFIDIHSYWLIHKAFSNNGFRVEISCPKLQNKYLEQPFNTYEEACEAAIKYCLENLI